MSQSPLSKKSKMNDAADTKSIKPKLKLNKSIYFFCIWYLIFTKTFCILCNHVLIKDDERSAYIKWVVCQSYSVIPMKLFELKDAYNLNEIYFVKWNSTKLEATLLFIGNL